MPTSELARAKVNLALHVIGQRPDGYHLLDSIVGFALIGDTVTLTPTDVTRLTVQGPFAHGLSGTQDNIVLRALHLFDQPQPVEVTLTKNLPVASGIGGGSADAAACLRAYVRLTSEALPDQKAVLSLGADVPVCLDSLPVQMGGIGEVLEPINLPDLPVVLVNPGVSVSTPTIFQKLASKANPPLSDDIPQCGRAGEFIAWLANQRNDLQSPAIATEPVIADVLKALQSLGAELARMSGSGATCFALFSSHQDAVAAANSLKDDHPNWWVQSTTIIRYAT